MAHALANPGMTFLETGPVNWPYWKYCHEPVSGHGTFPLARPGSGNTPFWPLTEVWKSGKKDGEVWPKRCFLYLGNVFPIPLGVPK